MAQDHYILRCFLATLSICSCSYFMYFNLGICNSLTFVGRNWLLNNNNSTNQTASSQWSFFYGSFTLGAAIGGLPSSIIAEKIGRKVGLLITFPISIVGSIITTISITAGSYYSAIFGRLLVGLSCGLVTALGCLWICELAPIEKRGLFISLEGLAYYLSDLLAYVLSLPTLMGNEALWSYTFLITAAIQFLLFPVIVYLPESPRHIFFTTGHSLEKLYQSIRFYHGSTNVDDTLQELEAESELHIATSQTEITYCQLFNTPHLRRFFLLSILLFGTTYFCGLSSVISYSTNMFETAGFSHNLSAHLTVLISVARLPLLLFPIFIDRIGRRPLCLFSSIGCGLVSLVIVLTYCVATPSSAVGWWLLLLFIIYAYGQQIQEIAATTAGMEILCQQTRSKGMMVGILAFNLEGTILTTIFLPMANQLGMAWAMTPYAIVPFILAVVLWGTLPETRMRSVEEIYGNVSQENDQQPLIDNQSLLSYGTGFDIGNSLHKKT